jgi:hypothetical protein
LSPILEAALELQAFCSLQGWRFCFIGGIVVPRWGEPRTTADADLTLLTGFGGEENCNSVGLDVSLGGLPFEERLIERSSDFAIGSGQSLHTCSAEDLIVLKAFAGREIDWFDVQGVAVRQAGRLDETLIFRELDPLIELKGTPEAGERLRQILRLARE